jgi:hypothetical protein
MLERPELADLVIPDLAKWEDWAVMDRLFDLYKTANDKNSWVRVPVVNYLRACPLPKAKELLKECEKIDPAAVKRANAFFPGAPTPPPDKASQAQPPTPPAPIAAAEPHRLSADGATLAEARPVRPASATEPIAANSPIGDAHRIAAALNAGVTQAAALRKTPAPKANLWAILGVPWGVGLGLAVLQWSILRRR